MCAILQLLMFICTVAPRINGDQGETYLIPLGIL